MHNSNDDSVITTLKFESGSLEHSEISSKTPYFLNKSTLANSTLVASKYRTLVTEVEMATVQATLSIHQD
jgi:hypothetical protein